VNPRNFDRSNALSEEGKLRRYAKECTSDLNDAEKAEVACNLDKVAYFIRQKLLSSVGEQVQSMPLGVDRMPGAQVKTVARKIPRGFVVVNLGEAEQKEMRQLARELGAELRNMIRMALKDTKRELREKVRIQRLTGLGWSKQYAFLERNSRAN
jgi:hypothetical protein